MPLSFLAPFLICASAAALAGPPVYRCESNGKVGYSDAPCVGAKVVDATPNQGIDKMSGQSRKGREVQRAEFNAAFDQAFRPLTGKTPVEMDVLRHRVGLGAQDQAECRRLDSRLPDLEADARQTGGAAKAQADVDLYTARKRYFDLKC